jgi:hypothetical protein
MEFLARFKAAQSISAPLVTISSTDQHATLKMISGFFNPPPKITPEPAEPETAPAETAAPEPEDEPADAPRAGRKKKKSEPRPEVPIIAWDLVTGARGINMSGIAVLDDALLAIARANWNPDADPPQSPPPPLAQAKTKLPVTALEVFAYTPGKTVMVLFNGNLFFGTEASRDAAAWAYAQALLNLRDVNKEIGRMVILMGADFSNVPRNLTNDLLSLDEPLPTPADLTAALHREIQSWNDSKLDKPAEQIVVDEPTLVQGVNNLRGIGSNYMALQTIAMSISRKGLNTDELWERNKHLINATPGFKVWDKVSTYADIEGYEEYKEFYDLVKHGRKPVGLIVLLDEGEKQTKGADGSDGSAVTTEMIATALTEMNDRDYDGGISYGVSGAGKTWMAKCLAGHIGCRLLLWSISDAKSKYVGESNANIRQQFKVIDAVSGGNALFIMTVNGMNFPSPFLRRFTYGVHFFDLPSDKELQQIWQLYLRKYELLDQEIPDSKGWTGSDVERCAKLSSRLRIPLIKAKNYIIPVSVSAKKEIETVRYGAVGKYLSASYPGYYELPKNLPTRKKDAEGGRSYQDTDD